MTNILNLLDHIASDTKRSHKIALIEANRQNETFKRVLHMALDPYTNYYLRQVPKYTPVVPVPLPLDWALDQLDQLVTRQVTGNAAISLLATILGSVNIDDAVVIKRIISKDLRCGVADATVNAVIKDFIPSYPCMLARAFDAKNIKNIHFPAYSQLKADGLRVNFHVTNGVVTICGRSGKMIDVLGHMDGPILKLAAQFSGDVVFDGELVVVDDAGSILSRKVGNGILNKAIKGTISEQEASMVRAQLWDVIPMGEFKVGKGTIPCQMRFTSLSDAVAVVNDPSKFTVIPCKTVNTLGDAVEHFQEMLDCGYEGIILKNMHSIWEDTRSKHMVKMKAELEADLMIIGYNPGTGQFEGMVGSLIAASSDGKVVVSVSGFSHRLRQEITDTIDQLMGKIIAVTYNERITSQSAARDGVDSLFLPRFLEFRSDKTTADNSESIK